MSKISDDTICTNCGKPYEKHFLDRDLDSVYCYKEHANGALFTTEPTPEMIQEAEIARLRQENKLLRKYVERLDNLLRRSLRSLTSIKDALKH